jgi:hypothetical protein
MTDNRGQQLLLAGLDGFLATCPLYMLGANVAPPNVAVRLRTVRFCGRALLPARTLCRVGREQNGDRRFRWSPSRQPGEGLVGRGGVEPPTFRFSGGRSYQLSYLPSR